MPIDVLTAMQGDDKGLGKGLTTYPESKDREQQQAHADCLAMEREGKVVRHAAGGPETGHAAPFVIWHPVDASTPARPAPENEQNP